MIDDLKIHEKLSDLLYRDMLGIAGELNGCTTLYMGQSCKKTLFTLMKDASGKVHKYDFGDDVSSSYPYPYTVLAHSVIPDEVELNKASAVYLPIARIFFMP